MNSKSEGWENQGINLWWAQSKKSVGSWELHITRIDLFCTPLQHTFGHFGKVLSYLPRLRPPAPDFLRRECSIRSSHSKASFDYAKCWKAGENGSNHLWDHQAITRPTCKSCFSRNVVGETYHQLAKKTLVFINPRALLCRNWSHFFPDRNSKDSSHTKA
uniref:Uncharacterized protein n=1 Tax=Ditylenchus dipsaci TaxID=166011 RepID=A0A915CLT5_9BILA